ncbi:hypothetical protein L2E82_23074 [Cichorium intybus]|uniref:Uncharacterized protein n=2 Tax=Pentapetalae TaxID=1437201 RepID=A0ACB9DZY9_CICIN|nr:hypothetical protein L2E82_23074 [Cichorium intybus]
MASFGHIKVPFRDMSLGALNEPRSTLHGPYYCCLSNNGMALGGSFGFMDTERDVGCRVFIDSIFALIDCSRFSKRPSVMHRHVRAWWAVSKRNATWLILLLGARRRSDTLLVSTINDADQGSADVAFRTPLAPYEKSKFLGSGGSMVRRLKLKGIDERAPPRVEPAA